MDRAVGNSIPTLWKRRETSKSPVTIILYLMNGFVSVIVRTLQSRHCDDGILLCVCVLGIFKTGVVLNVTNSSLVFLIG